MSWTPDETGFDEFDEEFVCPVTGNPCMADMDGWYCEDYGCAMKLGLFDGRDTP